MALKSQLALATRVGELAGYTMWDRLRSRPVTSLADVPASVSQLTPQWLTAAMCSHTSGAKVESFELLGGSSGTTTRDRIALSYNDAGRAAGLADVVFAKSSPKFTSRLVGGLIDALQAEAGFYRDLRPKVAINAPDPYHIALDKKSMRSMYLLEDVGHTKGAKFGNPLTMYVDKRMAESMVKNLATYHGAFWEQDSLASQPWIRTSLAFQMKVDATIGFKKRSLIGVERARDFSPGAFVVRKKDIWPALMGALSQNVNGPVTLLHSDMHIGNWYQDDLGEMGLFDWQAMTIGGWALDVSYALASALTVEDRREWERDLLALYLDELGSHGGRPPKFEHAMSEYRAQIMHGLVFWLFTIGSGPLQPRMQPDDISQENVKRLVQATVDHGALDL